MALGKSQAITKVISFHPLFTMDICTKNHGNPPSTSLQGIPLKSASVAKNRMQWKGSDNGLWSAIQSSKSAMDIFYSFNP